MQQVSLADIKKNRSSYVDPNGYVFEHEGTIYRCVFKGQEAYYRGLFDDGTVEKLVSESRLVPSTISDLGIDNPDAGFIIRHERIEPETYCVEWPPAMLQDAAMATVQLLLALNERDSILQDAYPWNIVFRGPKPVFVDFTSIVRADTPLIWPAYGQFQSLFLRPIELSAQGKGAVARALMYNNISGVSIGDFYRNTTFTYKLTHPFVGLGLLLDSYVQQNAGLKSRLTGMAANPRVAATRQIRARFFGKLQRRISAYGFDTSGDVWSSYYKEIDPGVNKDLKTRTVREIIDRLRPGTVVDIGCNTGVFSIIAAESGARVISVDSSEACINHLYAQAKEGRLNITPLISDVLCPTPPFGFMGSQYPSLIERSRSELVICLALMHHLHISGRQSFDRVAELMGALSTRHIIFEFVAMEDANNDLLGAGREINYSLQDVAGELRRFFPVIEVLESDRPTRKILVCSKNS
jgi:SAM-dependent methyltransferase